MRVRRRVLDAAFLVVALAGLVWALAGQADGLRAAWHRLDAGDVLAAAGWAALGLLAQLVSWRALLASAGPVPSFADSADVYFRAQLGKYVPGGVWTVVGQARFGGPHGISRARGAVVALGALAVLLVVGGVVAAAGLVAGSPASLGRWWWLLPLAALGGAALTPPVLDRLLAAAQRLLRRPGPAVRVHGGQVARSAAAALAMWAAFGLHAAALVAALRPVSAADAVLATGAFALAWVVGLLVVVAPAGAGAREAALVVALGPLLDRPDALLVALVSRVLMALLDALAAGVAAGAAAALRRRAARRTAGA